MQCEKRARILYMQSNSSPVCLLGIRRAVQFTVLSSVCVRQLRNRSLKFSTWVLGCSTGRGSMLCVMSLTWNEPCHTHPTCIWYYHPASAIQLSSWFHISEANPSNDKRNPKWCVKDFCPKGRARRLIKKDLLFCTWVNFACTNFWHLCWLTKLCVGIKSQWVLNSLLRITHSVLRAISSHSPKAYLSCI